ncbi:MAG TPA: GNAT family N-acetyltransferase [Thermodesulfobacteriota bacterium]
MMPRTYRLMHPDELPQVVALVRSARLTWTRPPSVMLVADEAGEIIGCCGLDFEGDAIQLGPLVVAKPYRKTLTAFRLLEAAEAFLAAHGATRYVMACGEKDRGRLAMLERLGAQVYAKHARRLWLLKRIGAAPQEVTHVG